MVDQDGESWYKSRDLVIRGTQSNVINIKTPFPRPSASNGLNGHHADESHEVVLSETPTPVPSNFHDLSISDANPTAISDSPSNGVDLRNGTIDERANVSKCEGTQENSVKVNETHEYNANPEPEVVSKSPDKLVPSSPSPVMIGTNSPESIVPNKTNDSINNNNVEEKSQKDSLRKVI